MMEFSDVRPGIDIGNPLSKKEMKDAESKADEMKSRLPKTVQKKLWGDSAASAERDRGF